MAPSNISLKISDNACKINVPSISMGKGKGMLTFAATPNKKTKDAAFCCCIKNEVFDTTGIVETLPECGHKCILPPLMVKQMVLEAKKNFGSTVGTSVNLNVAAGRGRCILGTQSVSKSAVRHHRHSIAARIKLHCAINKQ